MTATILAVDDDASIRTVISRALGGEGYRVVTAASLAEMRAALQEHRPDAIVSDVVLPDGDGLLAMQEIGAAHPELPIIIVSAQNTLTTAVRASGIGAYEYLPKPFDLDELARAVRGALRREPVAPPPSADETALPLIGRSPAMQEVYRTVARIVSTDLSVLISGESGTGKELVARAIHDLGPRAKAPFVAINMAAIPRDLIEAELFGHERGAFTGAQARAAGRFEQADGGTLFLDEIGDMPLEAQTRLLRVLQSGEFSPIGGARPVKVDARIVSATHRPLDQLIAQGAFREDLFYRLNVVPIALPPLRARRQDVALLARHFLDRAVASGLPRKHLSAEATELLSAHDWPGNVRELQNLMRRTAVLGRDATITGEEIRLALGQDEAAGADAGSLDAAVRQRIDALSRHTPEALGDGTLYDRIVAEIERPLFAAMLERHGGNQLRAAKALGINRNTLRKRLDDLAITAGRGRRPDERSPRQSDD